MNFVIYKERKSVIRRAIDTIAIASDFLRCFSSFFCWIANFISSSDGGGRILFLHFGANCCYSKQQHFFRMIVKPEQVTQHFKDIVFGYLRELICINIDKLPKDVIHIILFYYYIHFKFYTNSGIYS